MLILSAKWQGHITLTKMIDRNIVKQKLIQNIALPSINDEIETLIDRLIEDCIRNHHLIAEVKKVYLNDLNEDIDEILGDKLKDCERINIVLVSLGKISDIYINKIKNADPFESYVVNEIYNLMLEEYYLQTWRKLKVSLSKEWGFAGVIVPGDNISLEYQKIFFKYIFHPEVTLDDETLIINPLKTITFIVGEGSNFSHLESDNIVKTHTSLVMITINNENYWVPKGMRLYDVLVQNKIFFDSFCGGNHSCGKCLVEISTNEKQAAKLACDTYCYQGLKVITTNKMKELKIQVDYLGERFNLTDDGKKDYGMVFDIGTSTIVGGLYHLGTKKQVKVLALTNEQYLYGLDVISRISYSLRQENGLEILNHSIIKQLNHMIKSLLDEHSYHLAKIVIVGNPTMIGIINKINLSSLASYPYLSQVSRLIEVKAQEIGLTSDATVTFISGVSSFIGSDVLCGIVACNFFEKEKYCLLIDLGTNGEIALGNKNQIFACSSAAGPAFEGGRITCGVPSISGAINQFEITDQGIIYQTIDNLPPIGFCGSGIIDLTATLLNNGIINNQGLFLKDDLFEVKISDKRYQITQTDIRELQLAKSAIASGIEVLLKKASVTIDQLDTIFISGGFGSNININSARTIGLLPKNAQNIQLIGNSAFYGASLYLLEDAYQAIFSSLKSKIKVIDLNDESDFIDLFVKNLIF